MKKFGVEIAWTGAIWLAVDVASRMVSIQSLPQKEASQLSLGE